MLQHGTSLREVTQSGEGEKERPHAESADAPGAARNREDVAHRILEVGPGEFHQVSERRMVRVRVGSRQNRGMPAAMRAQFLLRYVDRVLMLGVGGDILEDVHRLQRLAELATLFAQLAVDRVADRVRMLVPQVGEHVAHRAGDVIAVFAILLVRLDPDAVRVQQHELAHAAAHLGDPSMHVPLGGHRE